MICTPLAHRLCTLCAHFVLPIYRVKLLVSLRSQGLTIGFVGVPPCDFSSSFFLWGDCAHFERQSFRSIALLRVSAIMSVGKTSTSVHKVFESVHKVNSQHHCAHHPQSGFSIQQDHLVSDLIHNTHFNQPDFIRL